MNTDFLQNRENDSSKLIVSRNTIMIFIQNPMEVYNEESLSLYTERINRTTVTEKENK